MLEDRSCLVSRDYPRTCDREGGWPFNGYRLEKIEVLHGKRPLENDGDEEAATARKFSKQSDAEESLETALVFRDISLSPDEQSSSQRHAGNTKIEVLHGKRPLENDGDEEAATARKFSKQSDAEESLETALVFRDISLSPDEQSSSQRHAGNTKIEVLHGKRPLENDGDEEATARKFSKQSDAEESLGTALVFRDISLSPDEQSSSQRHAGNTSDTSSLISAIGREVSISCLLHCSRSDYGAIASLNRSFRSLIRTGELYRLRQKNGMVEHWVYFSCQLLEWEAFDPSRRRWMHLPTMNPNECFLFSDKESLAVGTELLVFGKEVMSHVIYRYSLLTNNWTSGMSMNAPRCLFGSASLGEIAILAGGCDSQGNILSSAELYNSEMGTWRTLPSMNKPRKMCSGVFMDGKFYVIGGIGGPDSRLLTCGEEYDLEKRIWTEIPNMSPVRTGAEREAERPATSEAPPLVAVVNNELYAADSADMAVRKYDKQNKAWFSVGRLPERADSMNGWGLAFRACGDKLIVIGGPRNMGDGFIEVNSWVPSEGPPQWNLLGQKQRGSFVYNCAVMGC